MPKNNTASNNWKKNNPERRAWVRFVYRLKSIYGLTVAQFDAMVAAQNNCCAICGAVASGRRLDIDHCHTTGKIRALLCWVCNKTVGHIEKAPAPIESYLAYINKHKENDGK